MKREQAEHIISCFRYGISSKTQMDYEHLINLCNSSSHLCSSYTDRAHHILFINVEFDGIQLRYQHVLTVSL